MWEWIDPPWSWLSYCCPFRLEERETIACYLTFSCHEDMIAIICDVDGPYNDDNEALVR